MKTDKKRLWLDYIPMAFTAALIILLSDWKSQSLLKILPTLITLVVQILLARASRWAFLVGGINSILYALCYFDEGLGFQAFFAILISMPIQIYSYFNWKRNTVGGTPKLRTLSLYTKIATAVSILAVWLLCQHLLADLISSDGKHVLLDTLLFTLGITVTILSSVRYVDSQYIGLLSSVISLILWITITVEEPCMINYVIISAYNLFKGVNITISWTRIYLKSKSTEKEVI